MAKEKAKAAKKMTAYDRVKLARDAKRTELEMAAARMVIARIKAVFIGGPMAIARMVLLLLAVAALMLPFGTAVFRLPFYEETLSVGLIGVIQSFSGGLLPGGIHRKFRRTLLCGVPQQVVRRGHRIENMQPCVFGVRRQTRRDHAGQFRFFMIPLFHSDAPAFRF